MQSAATGSLPILQTQLLLLGKVVFLGTCFRIRSNEQVTRNLYRSRSSRCFNAVLITKECATKILQRGAIVKDFDAIDWLFNRYIKNLGLNAFYAYPPLGYEATKNIGFLGRLIGRRHAC